MDALFTTFLSPSIACPLEAMATYLASSLIEFDLINSTTKDMALKFTCGIQEIYDGLSYSDEIDEFNNMHVESCISMGFEDIPTRGQFGPFVTKLQNFDSPLSAYFSHQIYHMMVQRRVQSTFHSNLDCCQKLGNMDCCQLEKDDYCACCNMVSYQNMLNVEPCPCDKHELGDRYCPVHNLTIEDMDISDKSCVYTIYFDSTHIKPVDGDQCFDNTCYDDMSDTDNSFEIEFSTNCTSELDINLQFEYNLYDGGDEFGYNLYDSGDEFIQIIYSNDDDGNLTNESYDKKKISKYHKNCMNNYVNKTKDVYSKTDTNPLNLAYSSDDEDSLINESYGERKISKYHKHCTKHSVDKTTDIYTNMDTNLEKKVHFAEPDCLVKVHTLVAWAHAYKESRKNPWQKAWADCDRFQSRIKKTSVILEPILRKKISEFHTRIT